MQTKANSLKLPPSVGWKAEATAKYHYTSEPTEVERVDGDSSRLEITA